MKKVLLLLVAFASLALAQDAEIAVSAEKAFITVGSVIGAAIGLGLAALGGAIGIGTLTGSTVAGLARNPGMGSKLSSTMFISFALIEAQVIYMLVITLVLIFANPFL